MEPCECAASQELLNCRQLGAWQAPDRRRGPARVHASRRDGSRCFNYTTCHGLNYLSMLLVSLGCDVASGFMLWPPPDHPGGQLCPVGFPAQDLK